jgi:glutathione S-transferase
MMKLYDSPTAPNPRRVNIFAAEKGIELKSVPIDLRASQHKTPEMITKNPSGKIPILELEDGTCIGETVAICRYLESLNPMPNLFGKTPVETALIEMQHRFIEFELVAGIGQSWVNGPVVASMGNIESIPAAKERGDKLTRAYFKRLNEELSQRDYIAGDRFTVADITALCWIDFAAGMVFLRPEDELEALWRWHQRVSSRDSVKNTATSMALDSIT